MTNSANTSINKLPHLHKWATEHLNLKGKTVLDYGAGKYETGMNHLLEYGAKVVRFDPYNLDEKTNYEAALAADHGKVDVLLCSNVLNVIMSDRDLDSTLREIAQSSGICYFTMYEGNKSGIGGLTSKGYQRNIKTADWEQVLRKYFARVTRIGKVFKAL